MISIFHICRCFLFVVRFLCEVGNINQVVFGSEQQHGPQMNRTKLKITNHLTTIHETTTKYSFSTFDNLSLFFFKIFQTFFIFKIQTSRESALCSKNCPEKQHMPREFKFCTKEYCSRAQTVRMPEALFDKIKSYNKIEKKILKAFFVAKTGRTKSPTRHGARTPSLLAKPTFCGGGRRECKTKFFKNQLFRIQKFKKRVFPPKNIFFD